MRSARPDRRRTCFSGYPLHAGDIRSLPLPFVRPANVDPAETATEILNPAAPSHASLSDESRDLTIKARESCPRKQNTLTIVAENDGSPFQF